MTRTDMLQLEEAQHRIRRAQEDLMIMSNHNYMVHHVFSGRKPL